MIEGCYWHLGFGDINPKANFRSLFINWVNTRLCCDLILPEHHHVFVKFKVGKPSMWKLIFAGTFHRVFHEPSTTKPDSTTYNTLEPGREPSMSYCDWNVVAITLSCLQIL